METETRRAQSSTTELSSPAVNGDDGTGFRKRGRGRRTTDESQARGIRERLVAWNQAPEHQRVSLRTLAVELGTSHQLLSFYLKGLNDWQKKDYQRRAEAIRDRVEAENRYMTPAEQSEMTALGQASIFCMIQPVLQRLEKKAKAGKLSKQQIRTISVLALRGVPIAKRIIEKYKNNLPARQAR